MSRCQILALSGIEGKASPFVHDISYNFNDDWNTSLISQDTHHLLPLVA